MTKGPERTIDYAIFEMINGYTGVSANRDAFVIFLSQSHLLKGVISALILWALWFRKTANPREQRIKIFATLAITIIAILAGKILARSLPFRDRPLFSQVDEVTVQHALNFSRRQLEWASSMPSDHASMFFALALCVYLTHRLFGAFLIVHAILIISLPRIYIGLHWPSDIFVGALVGILLAVVLFRPMCTFFDKSRFMDWMLKREQLMYPLLFLATYGVASMFGQFIFFAKFVYRSVG